jgi:hypothetical protein
MSHLTTLSNEYTASADFARQFNAAAMELKRDQLRIPRASGQPVDPREYRERLASMVGAVAQQLSEATTSTAGRAVSVPSAVSERLRARHKRELNWFLEDLRALERTLSEASDLDERQLALVDEVCDVADAAASATFRRLWRR